MIFICNHCGKGIHELNTPGDDVNNNLICPKCAKDLQNLLKKAKEIQAGLQNQFKLIP